MFRLWKTLTNTLRRYNPFSCELNGYPQRILPVKGWKREILTDDLLAINKDAIICRRFIGSYNECILTESTGSEIFIKCLPIKDLANLSTSLIGGLHSIEDFRYVQLGDGKKDWDGKRKIRLRDFKQTDFEKISGSVTVLGWKISDIHNQQLPYERSFQKKVEFDELKSKIEQSRKSGQGIYEIDDAANQIYTLVYTDLCMKNGKRTVSLKGISKVNHAPNNLNYWHYTIDEYSADNPDKSIRQSEKGWQKTMCEGLFDYLRHQFVYLEEVPDTAVIKNWERLV